MRTLACVIRRGPIVQPIRDSWIVSRGLCNVYRTMGASSAPRNAAVPISAFQVIPSLVPPGGQGKKRGGVAPWGTGRRTIMEVPCKQLEGERPTSLFRKALYKQTSISGSFSVRSDSLHKQHVPRFSGILLSAGFSRILLSAGFSGILLSAKALRFLVPSHLSGFD
jgi:hypothetical protein